MDFSSSPEALAFRDEVRALVERTFTPEVRERFHQTGTMHDWSLHRAIGDQGWLQQALPESLGGGGRDPEELAGLFRELELAGAPYDGISNVVMVSSVLAHMGNEMQKRDVLPKLLSGESVAALGYTEPDSGSDVAAARTRAERDGNGWRINGTKMFTSVAEESEWVLLLTRTTPEGPKHQGLTFFLVPLATDGVEIQPVFTLSGKRTNATFYDNVYVDDEWRVGEVDGGWQVMLVALSYERGVAGGVRDAERLLVNAEAYASQTVGDDGHALVEQPEWRAALARLAVDVEVADLLAGRAAWVSGSGRLPGTEGAHVKLFATEAVTRAANTFLDLVGPEGLERGDPHDDRDRVFEYMYRFAPVATIYGGTSEIQRNLVAQRGLGLPRGR
jgi:alkylation response protein AidB-like acyl-CoA dehydrogenase